MDIHLNLDKKEAVALVLVRQLLPIGFFYPIILQNKIKSIQGYSGLSSVG